MKTSSNITLIPAKREIRTTFGNNILTKVAAYCRVSTEQENQQNSYATQISYYTDYITSNPDWQLAGIYADEGISGTMTKNRTQFNKMIRAARCKKIDIILCKSISRFARNTVDCLNYIRELRSLGVTVIFEKENINTGSMSSEFAISLYASFAQAESESISRNITWGIERSFREGNVRYKFDQMLGYVLDENKKPCIIKDEAEIVRMIFEDYAGGYSATEIAEKLTEMGAKRKNGSSNWTRNHVYQILKNEKYAGDAILQKTYTVNCLTHDRKKNKGQKPKYFIQDCHEAIVDRKTYDMVRLELEKRKRNSQGVGTSQNTYRTKYCMSRLLICPYCGSFYKRTTWLSKGEKIGVWRCKNRMENGKKCPKSPSYHETVLQKAVLDAINSMIGSVEAVEETAELNKKILIGQSDDIESRIRQINESLAEIERKRDDILASVSGSMFERVSGELKSLNHQESELAAELESLTSQYDSCRRELLREGAARDTLRGMKPLTTFDNTVISRILSGISAVSSRTISVTFCGGHTVTQSIQA